MFVWIVLATVGIVAAVHCGGGDPCIYVNRDVGWIARDDSEYAEHQPPPALFDPASINDTSIFVAISSFRDKLCPITLVNLFTKATNPRRITTAVVQQNVPGDLDCLEEYCTLMFLRANPGASRDASLPPVADLLAACPFSTNILMNRLDGMTARGPTWARSYGSKMVGDQEFCLQTDSHMDFAPQWDTSMVDMWASTQNEYAVLSTYVTDSSDYDNIKDKSKGINGLHEVPNLCIVRFHGTGGMPRNFGTKCLRSFPRPKLTMTWGAGLSFAKCHAEKKVPYDPYTPGIFDGEEWSRAARYWTWGYDIYTPNKIFISHNYKKSQSDPNHQKWHTNTHIGQFNVQDSMRRLELLLHMNNKENSTAGELVRRSKYGLGDRRTFEQFKNFSGVDPARRQTTQDKCANIQYVPFREHPNGPHYIPEFHPDTFISLEVPDEGSIYYAEYEQSLKRAEVAQRMEKGQWEKKGAEEDKDETRRKDEESRGERMKPAEEGDLDLSSLIDDNDLVEEKKISDEGSMGEGNNNGANAGGAKKSGSFLMDSKNKGGLFSHGGHSAAAAVASSGKEDAHLYRSIAIDLSGFFMVCLMFYCICIPSRSLKTQ